MLSNRFAYKPLRYKPKLSSLVTAIGVSMFIEYFFSALPVIGPSPRGFPEVLPKIMWTIGSAQVSNYVVIDLVVAAALMIGLTLLVQKSPLGRAMRAVSQDKDAAKLMGIDVEGIISFTFLIGGAFAGAAGLLAGLTYPRIMPYMGILPGLKAFIAAVLGGIGNIPGAMLGAYIMGIAETSRQRLQLTPRRGHRLRDPHHRPAGETHGPARREDRRQDLGSAEWAIFKTTSSAYRGGDLLRRS